MDLAMGSFECIQQLQTVSVMFKVKHFMIRERDHGMYLLHQDPKMLF